MTEQNEQVEKRVYMSISFPNIPEGKSQELAKWLVDNTPGLSFNVFYDDPMQDEEIPLEVKVEGTPEPVGSFELPTPEPTRPTPGMARPRPRGFDRYQERGLDGSTEGR